MKQKSKLVAISTGLAAVVLAITLSSINKKDNNYQPRLDITNDKTIENYINDYQEAYEAHESLIIDDYKYYSDLYKKIHDGIEYDPFSETYTIQISNSESLTATKKVEENNTTTYYDKTEKPVRIDTGTKVKVYFEPNKSYEFNKVDDDTITVSRNNDTYQAKKITLNKDNSYAYSVQSTTYTFNEEGLLESCESPESKIVYEDGNIECYKEYKDNKLFKIKRADGTKQEIYHNFLPSEILSKININSLSECVSNKDADNIYIEYDQDDNIKTVVYEINNKNAEGKVIINEDRTIQGKVTYKDDKGTITEEKLVSRDDKKETKIIRKEFNGDKIDQSIYVYNDEGNLIQKIVNLKEIEHLIDNTLYFYDENHNVEKYYVYDNDFINYTEYDGNNVKISYQDRKKHVYTDYYPSGQIKRLNDQEKDVFYFEDGNISSYTNYISDKKVKIDGKEYTLNYSDTYYLYESGKLEKLSYTNPKDEKVSISYYESGVLQGKLINGSGETYYENGKINEIYDNNEKKTAYYENGNLKFIKTLNGYESYYENGNLSEKIVNNKTTTYYEDGNIALTNDAYLITYYSNNKPMKYLCSNATEPNKNIKVEVDGKNIEIKNGESIEVYENGKLRRVNKTNSYTEYYESGAIKEKVTNASGESYYETGEVKTIIEDGKVIKELYKNGQVKSETNGLEKREYFESGALKGIYNNGNLIEGRFENGELSYTNYDGEQRYYYDNGSVSSEVIDGKTYSYYSTGVLRSIKEENITTEYRDDRVYSVSDGTTRVYYPCAEDYSFHIDENLKPDETGMFDRYRYIYNNQELYRSSNWELASYNYDEEYGITDIEIMSRDDNQKYSIYTNEEYNRSK